MPDLRTLMDECISVDQWRALIADQLKKAQDGEKGALELLLGYRFGRPTTMQVPEEGEVEPFRYIAIPADGAVDPDTGSVRK